MNKKEEIEVVKAYNKQFDYMIENGKFRSTLDNWGSKERTDRYNTVKDLEGQVNYKGEIFILSHGSGGGVGMGAYPNSTTVVRVRL